MRHCLTVLGFVDLLKICLLIKNSKKEASNFYHCLTKPPFCYTWKPTRNSNIGRNNKGFSPLQHSLFVISVFIWQFHRSHMPDKAFWPLSMIGLFYDLVSGMDTNVCLTTKKKLLLLCEAQLMQTLVQLFLRGWVSAQYHVLFMFKTVAILYLYICTSPRNLLQIRKISRLWMLFMYVYI